MIELFLDELERISEDYEHTIPSYFDDAVDCLHDDSIDETLSKTERSKLGSLKFQLIQYIRMDVYGYNSGNIYGYRFQSVTICKIGRFDINLLAPYLIPALQSRYGKLSVIKKGNSYFTIGCESFTFKDVCNYTSPAPLSKYLAQWGVSETKSVFPYTYFNTVADISQCSEFPAHEAFYSDLKDKNISENAYFAAKVEYNRRKSLPIGHPEKMNNMRDWLIYYNILDVAPLCQALDNSFRTFYHLFNIDPSHCFSLPKLAQECMFGLYSTDAPLSYSFTPKMDHVRKIFRDNIIGGIVNVFSRFTDVRKEVSPRAPTNAIFAPDGSRFTKIMFLDFNSLYLTVQQNNFPTTPGNFSNCLYGIIIFIFRNYLGKNRRWIY